MSPRFTLTQLQSASWKSGWSHVDKTSSPLCPSFSYWSRSDEPEWTATCQIRAKVTVNKTPAEAFSKVKKCDALKFYQDCLLSVDGRLLDAEALVKDLQDEQAAVKKKIADLHMQSDEPPEKRLKGDAVVAESFGSQ